ncbi:MAG: DUF21 domain-containing protein [Salinarimonas sp.]|nr:DUF21 domain-containing protein [Salinarimonas sp.]
MDTTIWIWLGIALCLSQSAMLSGLNLAVFSISRLRLEAAAKGGDRDAQAVLALRADANYTLATILWANVGVNVLLTLLADSVLAGFAAFAFSTVVITFVGELFPQAYFSRHALWIAARLSPLIRAWRILLFPIAKPVGMLLDALVGREAIPWFREAELSRVLEHHAEAGDSEVGKVEARGAINFLALDDIPVMAEGEPVDPDSILRLPFENGRPVYPPMTCGVDDPILRRVAASGRKWIIVCDEADDEPRLLLVAPEFLGAALFGHEPFEPTRFGHHPLVVRDPKAPLGRMLSRLQVEPEKPGDDVIDVDVILLWSDDHRRIITGSDLLGRLMRRIARVTPDLP